MPSPLKKTGMDGLPYERPPEIQAWLERLEPLEPTERLRLLELNSVAKLDAAPTEALVHFLRRAWVNGEKAHFERIFRALLGRVEHSLRSAISDARMVGASNVRDEVKGRFLELVAKDCKEGLGRLDFFEIRFDKALVAVRTSVLRKFGPSTVKTVPLGKHGEDGNLEISGEVEHAAEEFLGGNSSQLDDPAFRSAFMAAIDGLPEDQKRVVGLLLQGFPIDSKEADVMTIAGILKCDERTVRNRRNRAFITLRAALEQEKS